MPRQPLGKISVNSNYSGGIKGRLELTSHWHSHIIDHTRGGQYPKIIADNLNIPPSTIKITIHGADSCYGNESQHESSHF